MDGGENPAHLLDREHPPREQLTNVGDAFWVRSGIQNILLKELFHRYIGSLCL